jgi:hypothetical protein
MEAWLYKSRASPVKLGSSRRGRIKKFYVGTSKFDAVNVGFTTVDQEGAFEFDTSLPGNSNAGHDTYGTDNLTEEERLQLVEILKRCEKQLGYSFDW